MLLRIGVVMSAIAVVVAVSVAVVIATRDAPRRASYAGTTVEEPLTLQRSHHPRPEPPARKETPAREAPAPKTPAPEAPSREAPTKNTDRADPLPAENPNWPEPKKGEAQGTRRFAPDPGAALTLTVPKLGIYDAPVFDSDSPAALDAGVAHVPETSMPWDGGAQRNVYLAGHRLGYYGTGSRLLFYRLPALGRGDTVILKGRGRTYRYRVAEKLVVNPGDSWVMGQVVGRDMVTLQTCTPIPTFEQRLIVRADRV